MHQKSRTPVNPRRILAAIATIAVLAIIGLAFVDYSYTESVPVAYLQDARMWLELAAGTVLPLGPRSTDYPCYDEALTAFFAECVIGGSGELVCNGKGSAAISRITGWRSISQGGPREGCFQHAAPSTELVRDFAAKNRRAAALRDSFRLARGYRLEPPSVLVQHRLGRSTDHLVVSRIGYDAAGSRALLYVMQTCGPTCGGGWYLQMGREGDHWKLLDACQDWVG